MDFILGLLIGIGLAFVGLVWLGRKIKEAELHAQRHRYHQFEMDWFISMPDHPVPSLEDFKRAELERGKYMRLGMWSGR